MKAARPQLETARTLDLKIRLARKIPAERERRLSEIQAALEKTKQALAEAQAQVLEHRESRERAMAWLQEHAQQAHLAEQWPRWEAQLRQLLEALDEARQAKQELDGIREKESGIQAGIRQGREKQQELSQQLVRAEENICELRQQLEARPSMERLDRTGQDLQQQLDTLRRGGELIGSWQKDHSRLESLQQAHGELQQQQFERQQELQLARGQQPTLATTLEESRRTLERLRLRSDARMESLRPSWSRNSPVPCAAAKSIPGRNGFPRRCAPTWRRRSRGSLTRREKPGSWRSALPASRPR